MRTLLPILLLALLAGCVTQWHPTVPNAYKYQNNPEAYRVYMHGYGVGLQNGWDMVTTDLTDWSLYFTNASPTLQAAGLDGFGDGERAAWKARTDLAIESRAKMKQSPNTALEPTPTAP